MLDLRDGALDGAQGAPRSPASLGDCPAGERAVIDSCPVVSLSSQRSSARIVELLLCRRPRPATIALLDGD